MIRYSTVVSIARHPADVMAALLDPTMYPRWTEMVDTRFEGSGPPTVGTRGSFGLPGGPLKGAYDMEILALEPERRLDIRIEGSGLTWISRITLEPEGSGTRMTYAGEISLGGWRRALEPLMAREAAAGEAKEAERFKALLEAEQVAVLSSR
jgi:uncharacterized protein YndB with AHSA1/START domain